MANNNNSNVENMQMFWEDMSGTNIKIEDFSNCICALQEKMNTTLLPQSNFKTIQISKELIEYIVEKVNLVSEFLTGYVRRQMYSDLLYNLSNFLDKIQTTSSDISTEIDLNITSEDLKYISVDMSYPSTDLGSQYSSDLKSIVDNFKSVVNDDRITNFKINMKNGNPPDYINKYNNLIDHINTFCKNLYNKLENVYCKLRNIGLKEGFFFDLSFSIMIREPFIKKPDYIGILRELTAQNNKETFSNTNSNLGDILKRVSEGGDLSNIDDNTWKQYAEFYVARKGRETGEDLNKSEEDMQTLVDWLKTSKGGRNVGLTDEEKKNIEDIIKKYKSSLGEKTIENIDNAMANNTKIDIKDEEKWKKYSEYFIYKKAYDENTKVAALLIDEFGNYITFDNKVELVKNWLISEYKKPND